MTFSSTESTINSIDPTVRETLTAITHTVDSLSRQLHVLAALLDRGPGTVDSTPDPYRGPGTVDSTLRETVAEATSTVHAVRAALHGGLSGSETVDLICEERPGVNRKSVVQAVRRQSR